MCYGTELTSNAVLAWCGQIGVEWHYIAPGKPMQNGYVESFILTAPAATLHLQPFRHALILRWQFHAGVLNPSSCVRNRVVR